MIIKNFISPLPILIFMMLFQLAGQTLFQPAAVVASRVTIETAGAPCPHKCVENYCQSFNKFQNYTLTSNLINFFTDPTIKLYFIFILGLLTLSHNRRLEKPPKYI